MKIAEVIPLYKGKQRDLVINYRSTDIITYDYFKTSREGDLLTHL